jgi:riboflavin biosynthesis pyrimidine reductase
MMAFLKRAYGEGIPSILVEGGQSLATSFFEYGCVNRLYIFYGNKIVGKGLDGIAFSRGLALHASIELAERRVRCFGDTVMITGKPEWK